MSMVNPSGWDLLKAQTLSAIFVMLLCSVELSSFEEHDAKLAVPQITSTAISNQILMLGKTLVSAFLIVVISMLL
jgi:hypothetical protein